MAGEKKAFDRARAQVVRGRTALLIDTRNEIQRLLREALVKIQTILAAQPTDYQQWALPRLAQEIRQQLALFDAGAGGVMSEAAARAWQLGQDLVDKPLAAVAAAQGAAVSATQVHAALGTINTRQLVAMRAFMTDRIKDIALTAANKINAELGLVVIGVQSPGQAITAVRRILGEESRARAATIVRTELSRAYAVASFERLQQAAKRVPGLQKQWRKSGKAHPRPHHDVIDGQVRDVALPFTVKPFGRAAVELMYPHDPKAPAGEVINCGCLMIPFKANWTMSQPGRAPGGLEGGPSVRELLAAGAVPGPRRAGP